MAKHGAIAADSDSDMSEEDFSPSSRHRKITFLKHQNSHKKLGASSQLPDSIKHPSVKTFRRDHSPQTTSDNKQIPPVPSTMTKAKQRPVVLLTPRKAPKQPHAKHSNGLISGVDRNDGADYDLPEASSSSKKKGKSKEREDPVVRAFPDKHSTARKGGIPFPFADATGSELVETVSPSPSSKQMPKGADFAEASSKRSVKRLQSHSLKRKRDSCPEVSDVTTQEGSSKRHMTSDSQVSGLFSRKSSFLQRIPSMLNLS
jgi:hypothetical protein